MILAMDYALIVIFLASLWVLIHKQGRFARYFEFILGLLMVLAVLPILMLWTFSLGAESNHLFRHGCDHLESNKGRIISVLEA